MVMDREETIKKLSECIRRHCLKTAQAYPEIITPQANYILIALEDRHERAGHSNDAEKLQNISEQLTEIMEHLQELSRVTKTKINFSLNYKVQDKKSYIMKKEFNEYFTPKELFKIVDREDGKGFEIMISPDIIDQIEYNESELYDPKMTENKPKYNIVLSPVTSWFSFDENPALDKYLQNISSFAEAINTLKDDPLYRGNKISKSRNYKGAIVVSACKEIWRTELHLKYPDAIGTKKVEPNKSVHQDIDCEYSVFIKEVFDILNIGMEVTSAFNSLRDIGGEEALNKYIDISEKPENL